MAPMTISAVSKSSPEEMIIQMLCVWTANFRLQTFGGSLGSKFNYAESKFERRPNSKGILNQSLKMIERTLEDPLDFVESLTL